MMKSIKSPMSNGADSEDDSGSSPDKTPPSQPEPLPGVFSRSAGGSWDVDGEKDHPPGSNDRSSFWVPVCLQLVM